MNRKKFKIIIERRDDTVTAVISGWDSLFALPGLVTEGAEIIAKTGFNFSRKSSRTDISASVCGGILVLKQAVSEGQAYSCDPMAAAEFLSKTIIKLWAEHMPIIMRVQLCRF